MYTVIVKSNSRQYSYVITTRTSFIDRRLTYYCCIAITKRPDTDINKNYNLYVQLLYYTTIYSVIILINYLI